MSQKYRRFTFTDYVMNYDELFQIGRGAQYMLGGKEQCPDTGRWHVQGMIIYKNPRSFKAVVKEFNGRHVEVMRAGIEVNRNYCTKDFNVFIELGEKPKGQGARSDLGEYVEKIVNGANLTQLFDEDPEMLFKFSRHTEKMMQYRLNKTQRNWEMDVRIYWGKTETGKTRSVYDEFGLDNVYKKVSGKWFDGYTGQNVILIDDFIPDAETNLGNLLKLLDRYPHSEEVKGGTVNIVSKVIIFTSNVDPKEWFPFAKEESVKAFFRRVKTIKFFGTTSGTEVGRR